MSKDKTYREDELEEIIYCTTGCGSNADSADGFGYCTCGAEEQRQAIQEHIEGKVLEGRIDEVGKFIDAITENEAEREMRGEDCIESHQWQRLSKMADYRIKQLKDKGGSK